MHERVEILPDAESLAARTSEALADAITKAIDAKGRCTLALSGGKTPAKTFAQLARSAVDWPKVDIFQVDERVAPDGHPDRNLTLISTELLANITGPPPEVHPIGVAVHDLNGAADDYAKLLEEKCGSPPSIDVVQLGIGPVGHTASLFPGDSALDVDYKWVVWTNPKHGYLRMTLTFPVLERSGFTAFIVQGADYAEALQKAVSGDPSVPAARIKNEETFYFVDETAAKLL